MKKVVCQFGFWILNQGLVYIEELLFNFWPLWGCYYLRRATLQYLCCICFFPQTASHVKARHELLQGAIGVFPEEKQAHETLSILSWILPLIAIIGSFVDIILVVVFMQIAHPWKDILFGQIKELEEAQPMESTDIHDTQSKVQVRFSLFKEIGKQLQ